MITLLVLTAGQLYNTQPSLSFARAVPLAPPLPVSEKSPFKLSIFNGTKNDIVIPGEDCKWGYEMISFELVDPNEKSYFITRKPHSWKANLPISVQIPALGNVIRKIDFGDGTWQGLPTGVTGQKFGWKIKATAKLEDSKTLKFKGMWTGKLEAGFTHANIE